VNHYTILGVERDATQEQIKSAYREATMKWHPDRNPGNPEAEESFKSAAEAYAILGDPARRQIYNLGMTDKGFDPSLIDPSAITEDVLVRGFVSLFGNFFDENVPDFREHVRKAAMAREERKAANRNRPEAPRQPAACSMCKGKGKIVMAQGSFAISVPCPSCRD
jgi:molecular chaperone DnaJ